MKCWRCNGSGSVLQEFRDVGWVSKLCPICHGKGEEKLSNKDILVLADVQNGFRNEHTDNMIKELGKFVFEYRFNKIMATKFLNCTDSLYVKELEFGGMMTSEQQEIVSEVKPFVSAIYMKNKYNCVDAMFLNQLRILNGGVMPSQVLVAGISASVLAMSVGLFDAGIRPIILVDFVASPLGEIDQPYGLKLMESMFGKQNLLKLG